MKVSKLMDIYALEEDSTVLLTYLQEKGLLPISRKCPTCGRECRLQRYLSSYGHDYNFVCQKDYGEDSHLFVRSLSHKTWFHGLKVEYGIILKIIYFYMVFEKTTIPEMVLECKIPKKTVLNLIDRICKICISVLFERKIGGADSVVEVDESFFGKEKPDDGIWVFGGVERGSSRCFLVPVKKRDKRTLLPILKEHVLPGTTVISDCWKAYKCLEDEGYQHLKVDSRLTFVDPVSGAHTNTIRGLWSMVKKYVPSHGNLQKDLTAHLARFLWRRGQPEEFMFENFLEEIARLHPLNVEADAETKKIKGTEENGADEAEEEEDLDEEDILNDEEDAEEAEGEGDLDEGDEEEDEGDDGGEEEEEEEEDGE